VKILVLNSGSSSIKYELYDMSDRTLLAGGAAERIAEDDGRIVHGQPDRDGVFREESTSVELPDHATALDRIMGNLEELDAESVGLAAIGHRVVHGGEAFIEPTLIDERVIETIRGLSPLAPLHNPANVLCIEVAMTRQPDLPQVAVFDTAFHQTIPPHAYRYAVPEQGYESVGVRRYGFHGTSHAFVSKEAARYLHRPLQELHLIVLHLGNGASVTAVAGGKSIDTSMGLTPLEGLVMGTRSGDVDPGVISHMAREAHMSIDEIDAALNVRSGLEGLCGVNDMRDAMERGAKGDPRAKLALDIYVYRIQKYIGAYTAALGRLDGIVFTAGVGENSAEIRARICEGLGYFGVALDDARNRASERGVRPLHREGAEVAVLVVPTNEELEIADQTLACIGAR
jgi:acetate kinase